MARWVRTRSAIRRPRHRHARRRKIRASARQPESAAWAHRRRHLARSGRYAEDGPRLQICRRQAHDRSLDQRDHREGPPGLKGITRKPIRRTRSPPRIHATMVNEALRRSARTSPRPLDVDIVKAQRLRFFRSARRGPMREGSRPSRHSTRCWPPSGSVQDRRQGLRAVVGAGMDGREQQRVRGHQNRRTKLKGKREGALSVIPGARAGSRTSEAITGRSAGFEISSLTRPSWE